MKIDEIQDIWLIISKYSNRNYKNVQNHLNMIQNFLKIKSVSDFGKAKFY